MIIDLSYNHNRCNGKNTDVDSEVSAEFYEVTEKKKKIPIENVGKPFS